MLIHRLLSLRTLLKRPLHSRPQALCPAPVTIPSPPAMRLYRGISPAVQFLLVANPAMQLSRRQTNKLQKAIEAASQQLGTLPLRSDRTALINGVLAATGTGPRSLLPVRLPRSHHSGTRVG
jgi:hypothetical protein